MTKRKAISLKCMTKLISYIFGYIGYILVTYKEKLKKKYSYIVSYMYMPLGIYN